MDIHIPQQLEEKLTGILNVKKQEALDGIIQLRRRNPVEYEKQKADIEAMTCDDIVISFVKSLIRNTEIAEIKARKEQEYKDEVARLDKEK